MYLSLRYMAWQWMLICGYLLDYLGPYKTSENLCYLLLKPFMMDFARLLLEVIFRPWV